METNVARFTSVIECVVPEAENRTWRLFFLEENENVRVLSFEFFFLLFLKHGHREKDSRFENAAQSSVIRPLTFTQQSTAQENLLNEHN